ncbi:MAG: NAD(P)H-dependent oxidoreductase [Gammaproteobacteria bacterium]|nr:NAD(P)H-dependent oxidoreductase [Gammaproteobacteria bacterium]MDX5375562.1 NAD(P)H-dependent oxidoreductase [Gammaproteobacteria bacterium]
MTTLLRIDSSLRRDDSDSRALADRFVTTWRQRHPEGRVLVRDLAVEPVPHLDGVMLAALGTSPEARDAEAAGRVALADALLAEFMSADEIVLAVPMYNFGIPSTLKAYLDHVARAGVTFRYTAAGPEGLAGDKRVTLLLTRGGRYTGSPLDHQAPYLRTFFGFLGITDIREIVAEGLNIDADTRTQALAAAVERLNGRKEAA